MVAQNRLLVFLKAPRLGFVKTRIAATLGDVAALAAYREIVAAVLDPLRDLPGVELRFTPDDAPAEVRAWQRASWVLAPQGSGDLGERLARAFAEQFMSGARKVIVVGADCPAMSPTDLGAALDALDEDDLVLGPATDGGYWLIGLRAPRPWLFRGIAWSTPSVFAQTESKARMAGLRVARLRELSDIDTEADWRRWQENRRAES